MTDVVIFGDTFGVPELRHEVPVGVPDPFLYVETGGARHVVVTSLELPILGELGLFELHPFDEFGIDELRRTSSSNAAMLDEVAARALRALGVEKAVVPGSFPLATAERLRADGIELTADRELFVARRRSKNGIELAGIRRAQQAAEAGMEAARVLLREAESDGHGALLLDGSPLTVERVKAAISAEFIANDASASVFVVSHGAQAAIGHHLGEGALRAGETIVIDLWPRDNRSSCYADMTRTFVVGEVPAEIAEWHRLCLEALEQVRANTKAGVLTLEVFGTACAVFEAAGHLTQRTKVFGEPLHEGFFHSLGHGVGLEVHEPPSLGLVGSTPLVPGDVIAVEPGLYRPGLGGVRLEDLLLVADDGVETLTSFPYDLEP